MNIVRKLTGCMICIFLCMLSFIPAYSLDSSTLYNGCKGDEVRVLQQALIDLGYLRGTADGVFGNNTENAVRKFQKKNKLSVDGLAGSATRQLILKKAGMKQDSSSQASDSEYTPQASSKLESEQNGNSQASASLFSNYASIRYGNRGSRVRTLQQALISLGYMRGSADGVFGKQTRSAVQSFQRAMKLSADGIAGKSTLLALRSVLSGQSASPDSPSDVITPSPLPAQEEKQDENDLNEMVPGPSASAVQLLHWFNDVKPVLSSGQHLLVYDPSSGLSWTLRVLARGRHCDAEPLTVKDTRTMVAAFGGVNTWNQKPVYVRLPDGRWSLASTHDMPHDSGTIKDNGFSGHLCVHFLRDMDEAKKNDPNYGVANQETIRASWKRLTGDEIH